MPPTTRAKSATYYAEASRNTARARAAKKAAAPPTTQPFVYGPPPVTPASSRTRQLRSRNHPPPPAVSSPVGGASTTGREEELPAEFPSAIAKIGSTGGFDESAPSFTRFRSPERVRPQQRGMGTYATGSKVGWLFEGDVDYFWNQ